jgi:hypothetical protein
VGLDAVKVIEEYEKIYAKGRIEPAEAEVKPSPEEAPEKKIIDSVKWAKEHSKILKYVLAGLGGLIIIIVILLSLKTGSNKVNRGTAEPSHKLQLSIQVDRQVYLMVSMDGSDSSDYILQPEAPKDFLAETRIWVFSSDIGATRMILNGKNYGPLGASGWSGHFRVDSNGVNLIKTYPPLR